MGVCNSVLSTKDIYISEMLTLVPIGFKKKYEDSILRKKIDMMFDNRDMNNTHIPLKQWLKIRPHLMIRKDWEAAARAGTSNVILMDR